MERRDIKLRAWVISEKRMISEILCFHKCGGISWDNTFNHDRADKQAYIWGTGDLYLMQYTGLQDSNGKDIYEGDIVYIAGYGDYEVRFPFVELYEAMAENDIGEIVGEFYTK